MSSTVSRKPILVLDTSAINQLTGEKDFPALPAIVEVPKKRKRAGRVDLS
jgi:hypothetical protein